MNSANHSGQTSAQKKLTSPISQGRATFDYSMNVLDRSPTISKDISTRIFPPPSRLSPTPGTSIPLPTSNMMSHRSSQAMDEQDTSVSFKASERTAEHMGQFPLKEHAPKRGYRACVHCRLRKAKCDLGDVNSPSEPPCTRCRREQRNCVFLPSKRRKKAQNDGSDVDANEKIEVYPPSSSTNETFEGLAAYSAGSLRQPGGIHHDETINQLFSMEVAHRPQMPGQGHLGSIEQQWSTNATQNFHHTQESNLMGTMAFNPQPIAIGGPSNIGLVPSNIFTRNAYGPLNAGAANPNQAPADTTPVSMAESSLGSASAQGPSPSTAFVTGNSTTTTATNENHSRRKRRRTGNEPDADVTRRIVAANFSNETDALEILAHAATDADGRGNGSDGGEDDKRKLGIGLEGTIGGKDGIDGHTGRRRSDGMGRKKSVGWDFQHERMDRNTSGGRHSDVFDEEDESEDREVGLEEFVLVRLGIVGIVTLQELVSAFFIHHHPVLPIFQTARIPRTPAQLASLSSTDPFLLACIILVASRHHPGQQSKQIHQKTWCIVRDALADFSCSGLPGDVGFVEGVLLLAENLPRELAGAGSSGQTGSEHGDISPIKWDRSSIERSLELLVGRGGKEEIVGLHGMDNRRSWSLTGIAIRAAYGLGLDQLSLELSEEGRTSEVERARSAWTWCYLYDRTIGLRTGRAFWSRGPSLCFTGYSHINQTGETAARLNFPFMLSPENTSPNPTNDSSRLDRLIQAQLSSGNDSASLMQALTELTQIMTNAHDILYPSTVRTASLVKQGEYFKFLDHFSRALQSFRAVWKGKVWQSDTVKELTWCTYHFVRLYISSFAFQAHVQRATQRAAEEEAKDPLGPRPVVSLFPRGSATSPDALYIYESIDAAHEVLQICIRLGQMGSLRYLPIRYLINFAYSGTFALKATYSGAVLRKDMVKTREIVDHVCAALVLACPDKDHPASRYGQMLRVLSRKLEQLSDASAVPSRFPSPEPTADANAPSTAQPMDSQSFNHSLYPWQLNTPDVNSQNPTATFSLPHLTELRHPGDTNDREPTLSSSGFMMDASGMGMDQHQHSNGHVGNNINGTSAGALQGLEGIFDFDVDVNFNLDGFWDDFTLGEGQGGFPFR